MVREFNISLNEVVEYIYEHSDNPNIKYREALFVKYIRDNFKYSKEAFNMVINRYNILTYPLANLEIELQHLHDAMTRQMSFKNYISSINKLDISGICYMMFPIMKLYKIDGSYFEGYEKLLEILVADFNISNTDQLKQELIDTMQNYQLLRQVKREELLPNYFFTIKLDKNRCLKMIDAYQQIYGQETVTKIKTNIKNIVT